MESFLCEENIARFRFQMNNLWMSMYSCHDKNDEYVFRRIMKFEAMIYVHALLSIYIYPHLHNNIYSWTLFSGNKHATKNIVQEKLSKFKFELQNKLHFLEYTKQLQYTSRHTKEMYFLLQSTQSIQFQQWHLKWSM